METNEQSQELSGSAAPATPEEENARLKERIAFLEKKLQLVGSVTRHDVLNQLTAIVGYNELLSMTLEDEKTKTFLDREKQATDKIRRLFQFAKDYQNLAIAPPRWQNLTNATNRAREACSGVAIRIQEPAGAMIILADPLFDRALQYIFENTRQHAGKPTEIRIAATIVGPHAELIIEDDGTGIPAKDKERILERGFGKGVGWGLFLAREILGVTGLSIIENGEPEKGARFVITLPAGTFQENGIESSVL